MSCSFFSSCNVQKNGDNFEAQIKILILNLNFMKKLIYGTIILAARGERGGAVKNLGK